jgi:hypothetical protein
MLGDGKMRAAGEPDNIAALDDQDLRDRLNALPLDRQIEIFRASGWQERVKVIKNSGVADRIMEAMPDEEVLLTFKGAGEEMGLALLPYCTGEQLRFILDIDLWSEYAVDEEQVLKWLGFLVSSGEKTIVDFVLTCDIELVTLFLSKLVRFVPIDDAVEMGEELTSIMPDEAFIVQALIPDETSAIRILLSTIMVEDRDLYGDLRYSTYRAIAAETEEEAYRWRASRLEEKGILEYDEAARIYECLRDREVRDIVAGKAPPYYRRANDIQVPAFYPMEISTSRTLYCELLDSLKDNRLRSRIAGDASYVTNRLLIADGKCIGDVEATAAALGRLFSLANVGLQYVAKEGGRPPAKVLESAPVSDLFRLGLGLVTALGPEADTLGRRCAPGPDGREYALFEDYHIGVLKGLRMRTPMHYDPGAGEEDYRNFRTLEEIATARAVLAQVSVLQEACCERLGVLSATAVPAGGPAADTSACAPADAGRMNFGNVLTTGLARFVINGDFGLRPLEARDLEEFLSRAFVGGGRKGRALDGAASEKYAAWLKRKTGFRGHKWAIFEAYLSERLEMLEEDLGGASSGADVDPILIGSILLAR